MKSFEAECNIPEVYDEAVQNQPITDRKPLGFIPTKILTKPEETPNVGFQGPVKQRRACTGLREIKQNPWLPVIRAIKKRAKEKKLYDYVYKLWKKTKLQRKAERRGNCGGMKTPKRVRFNTKPTSSGKRKQQQFKQYRKMCKLIRKAEPEEEPEEVTTESEDEKEDQRRMFVAKRLDLNTLDQSQFGNGSVPKRRYGPNGRAAGELCSHDTRDGQVNSEDRPRRS